MSPPDRKQTSARVVKAVIDHFFYGRYFPSMTALDDAFERVRETNSYYWGFWRPEKISSETECAVEVRFNVPDGDELQVSDVCGWEIVHRKTGMLFVRREQAVSKSAIEHLFYDALSVAVDNGWQFHSWCHDPDLPDWSA